MIDPSFARFEGRVLPEWIDGNAHMNLAYYVTLFDGATDALFEAVGFGESYRLAENCGPFAVESHILYENELFAEQRVRVATLVLGVDAKRLHLAHEMVAVANGTRAAAQEVMFVHVDLRSRRVVPFRDALRSRLDAAAAAHAATARPAWVGRRIAMPQR